VTDTVDNLAGRRLLILGGGLWQLEYVRQAGRMGIETWVTDWSPHAPARSAASHFEAIDLKDRASTLALAQDAHIEAVMTAADVGVPTAAFVAEQLGLPGHALTLAERATNKFEMRRHAELTGIPCPEYRLVRSSDEALAAALELGTPVIVKPVDNCSSRGVRWVDSVENVRGAADAALRASISGEALVEEFLTGVEGSIEALVVDGRAIVLGICDKTKSALPDRFDLELRYPGSFDPDLQSVLDRFAQDVTDAFSVVNGILHIEFLVASRTRTVHLIEFALRGCGSKVATHLMPALTGVDVVATVIRQAFGLRSAVKPLLARHGALHFLMFPPGTVAAVRGVEEARALPGVVDACVERQPGEPIGEVHDGRSRPGYVLVQGNTALDVQRTLAEVRRLVRIDFEGATDVAPLELTAVASHS
jgi:biotin carboxylase